MALEVVGSTPIVHPPKDRTRYGLFCCFPASVFCFPNKKQEYSVLLSGDSPLGAGLFFRSGADAGIWAMIQVARVGALSFVFLPFETLTVTGLAAEEILRKNGADANMVIGYANGTNSYLTPAAECGENGYETKVSARWYGLPECIPATEKTVLAAVRRLAEGLFKK